MPIINDGKFLQGSSPDYEYFGGTTQPGLPNITGSFSNSWSDFGGIFQNLTGAFEVSSYPGSLINLNSCGYLTFQSEASAAMVSLDASKSSLAAHNIYGNSDTVQPYAIFITYMIKY